MAIRKLLAYAAIYFLWGGSFLAIRQVVAVSPPFFAASVPIPDRRRHSLRLQPLARNAAPRQAAVDQYRRTWPGDVCRRLRLPLLGGKGSAFGPGCGHRGNDSQSGSCSRSGGLRYATAERKGLVGRCAWDFGGHFAHAALGTSQQSFHQVGACPALRRFFLGGRNGRQPPPWPPAATQYERWAADALGRRLSLSAFRVRPASWACCRGLSQQLELASGVRHGLSHPASRRSLPSAPMSGSSPGIRRPAWPAMPTSTRSLPCFWVHFWRRSGPRPCSTWEPRWWWLALLPPLPAGVSSGVNPRRKAAVTQRLAKVLALGSSYPYTLHIGGRADASLGCRL